MINEERLSEIIPKDISLRLVEPHIYSLYPPDKISSYDKFGGIYEVVACNRFYNRIVWGYWTSEYHSLCLDALESSTEEWVLDAGCGSLAFTAKTYLAYTERPVILSDQSIRMLRLAKSRLIKLNGTVPSNMVFLHGDVLQLPFKSQSFGTAIAMNLLHVIEDIKTMLKGLKSVLMERGSILFTTLLENNRFADKYLHKLGEAGYLIPRSPDQMLSVFDELGMTVKCRIKGNLAFIYYG